MIDMYLYQTGGDWQHSALSELPEALTDDQRIWLDLSAASPAEQQQLMRRLGIHPLMAEDFLRDRHPPKLEVQGGFSLMILRAFGDEDFSSFSGQRQLNLLYSRQLLITKQTETNGTGFRPAVSDGKVPSTAQWVKQAILAVSASYLGKLIAFEEEISDLEDTMLHRGSDTQMAMMMRYRSVMRKIDRNLAYQKDLFSEALYEEQHPLRQQFDVADVRDFYEKFERLHSMTQLYYDQLGDLLHGYMSTSSHQINERMKLLTMISAIFIPLTFIAGIYGMNFVFMPELEWTPAYFVVLGSMASIGLGALLWFKHKGWW